jgi:hypothetical protein
MQAGPFDDQAEHPSRQSTLHHTKRLDKDGSLIFIIRDMEVSWTMVVEIHANHYPQEARDLRHTLTKQHSITTVSHPATTGAIRVCDRLPIFKLNLDPAFPDPPQRDLAPNLADRQKTPQDRGAQEAVFLDQVTAAVFADAGLTMVGFRFYSGG